MSDLVQRLRGGKPQVKIVEYDGGDRHQFRTDFSLPSDLELEAADRIEGLEAREKVLEAALTNLIERYTSIANSGDAGFRDCELEDEVIAARRALNGKG